MVLSGKTERAKYPRALAGDKHSHSGRKDAIHNEPPDMDTAVRDELEAELDDGDDPIARKNDGLPEKVGKIDAFRGDALEQDPLVTQAKASIKQKLSSESGVEVAGASGEGSPPTAASKATEAKGL